MDLVLKGSPDAALDGLRAAVREAGWGVVELAGEAAVCRLVPQHGDAEPSFAASGWLAITADDDGTQMTVWLPEGGDPTARERLESALEQLEPRQPDEARRPLIRRLRRIEGQVRGLQRMIESGRDCEAVMTQLTAATTALKQTAARIVSEHFATCVQEAIESGEDITQLNQRLLNILF